MIWYKGAITPLLLVFYLSLLSLIITVLASCSNTVSTSNVIATGYTTEQGVVRVWLQNDSKNLPDVMYSIYSPYQGDDSQVSYYNYYQGVLRDVIQQQGTPITSKSHVRFDQHGEVIFMQRQQGMQKELLSNAQIKYIQQQARQQLTLVHNLHARKIILLQGQWQQGKVKTCHGMTVSLSLSPSQKKVIETLLQQHDTPYLAWTTSTQGSNLLLISSDDLCHTEPQGGHFFSSLDANIY